jgi:hypothetical protein
MTAPDVEFADRGRSETAPTRKPTQMFAVRWLLCDVRWIWFNGLMTQSANPIIWSLDHRNKFIKHRTTANGQLTFTGRCITLAFKFS